MPESAFAYFTTVAIRFFFLLTPFFVLSAFLSMTSNLPTAVRTKLAYRVIGAVIVISLVLYFFGNFVFAVFGITVDAFRIGAGALLFLSALRLVQGTDHAQNPEDDHDIAVVPLAIPITVGPATTGAILVMGAEAQDPWLKAVGCIGLLVAILCVGTLLILAGWIDRLLGRRGLRLLSKITGLVLSALAAQMIFTGIANFLNTSSAIE